MYTETLAHWKLHKYKSEQNGTECLILQTQKNKIESIIVALAFGFRKPTLLPNDRDL